MKLLCNDCIVKSAIQIILNLIENEFHLVKTSGTAFKLNLTESSVFEISNIKNLEYDLIFFWRGIYILFKKCEISIFCQFS